MSEHTPGPWLDPETLEWLHEPQRLLTRRENALVMGFAPELLAAAKRQEEAEAFHLSCVECEGNEIPELCEACFPLYDDARVMRRNAIAKAEPASLSQDVRHD